METLELNRSFWRDRPTFVTGGTGLVGSWLVRSLVEAGADVVCLVRDWVPQSELVRSRYIDKVKVVRGDIRDRDLMERILGEFEDSALMKAFGQGMGAAFPASAAIARDICRFYGVRMIGRTDAVRERYYAISAERRLTHPGVLAITSAARDEVFR